MSNKPGGVDIPWLLPDSVEELLPPAASELEALRRTALEISNRWGYALIMPPTIEYLESLLSGAAHDLDLQTFKLTDQLSGRMMGVRADITPQAARIDAHQLRQEGPVRLCYTGTVLRTRPDEPAGSRNPLQMGAELYGHAGVESDIEVISLMAEVLNASGIESLHLDLGHVGIFRALARDAGLEADAEARLWDALQRKATADIQALMDTLQVDAVHRDRLSALATLSGGSETMDEAARVLAGAPSPVMEALDALSTIAQSLQRWSPALTLHFDLGELRGYRYHTGVVFAAYTPGESLELARGGRYDDIGAVFGRARPATGFSTDLKALLKAIGPTQGSQSFVEGAIGAPWSANEALRAAIRAHRQAGDVVVWLLPGHEHEAAAMGCDRRLVEDDSGQWRVEPL
jgi:ATP phosphoribosyltransferase regulatory subunit